MDDFCVVVLSDADNKGITGFDFLNIADHLAFDFDLCRQGNDGNTGFDERQCTVFQFTAGIGFSMDIRNFF